LRNALYVIDILLHVTAYSHQVDQRLHDRKQSSLLLLVNHNDRHGSSIFPQGVSIQINYNCIID
jgi:hypothetical protein